MPIPFIVKRAKGLSLKSTTKADWISKATHRFMMRKAKCIWNRIGKYLEGKTVLDVGMGSGATSFFLINKGFDVTGVDVTNLSIYKDLKPVIYDGNKLPFRDNQFDTAVIIHVLHHCNNGLEVLKEAKRVSKRVIFIEDTFRNSVEWLFGALFDSLGNFEFWWHKYRKVPEWRQVITKNGWKVEAFGEWSEMGIASLYGRYCMFVIE
ncbi:hypothetical protein A3K29_00400 [Candidatus Collierbacteria bacterium RIFOXYB2_FULL_46_14]|uniref:Methyltransferase type 11 n=1 Tax=Candidatus Collierbacteria bacterium GW2011_GWA2_46_26 TaxID=1618381 RepID=A0A0G1SK42_9BACT|nr:MAG: Methyltransferase type 11 [Candidatus Collierbacteria bacterium GW2011_GWC2_44_13]KKU33650.1 MAG: Methyltransferase type 11 [Candidatus Collierbacteria bacterium GW2011_GWA2_46_26]OGD72598.1 MAG: hypothetical protein A3K29_00400 [Candidatus Collierbacteria bacterium RIFOXYB2_FULL_46_14]OGD75640.1 MAG: hypothetical protein A3K43_00400 [Candidatus Collierbacteria bacterium RIFOXYA2_FULL_46_20]OGD76976.1 MAG: hypothetical protein A3K39_00400 [Candidatus Collierbacteria bacterium RIFOXYC2_F